MFQHKPRDCFSMKPCSEHTAYHHKARVSRSENQLHGNINESTVSLKKPTVVATIKLQA